MTTNNIQLVAIDHGYWETKVLTKNQQFSFRSKYEKTNDYFNKNNTYALYYNNTEYLVGEGATMNELDYDKTSNELAKICTYAALAKLSNFVGNDYNIVVGYPLKLYSANKEIFAEYLKGDGMVECDFNFEKKIFTINQCLVLPQGASIMLSRPEKFKNKVVGIIDIGGLTINGCIVENMNIIRETIFTEDLGVFMLYNAVKKALDTKYNVNIQEYEIPSIIKNGLLLYGGKYKIESMVIVSDVMYAWVQNLKAVCKKNKWSNGIEVILTGGGSLILQKQLLELIPYSELSEDPVNDNANGYLAAGESSGY